MPLGLRTGAAMAACQIARLRGFPDHEQWTTIEIKTCIHDPASSGISLISIAKS
jgi:hypothetical protein